MSRLRQLITGVHRRSLWQVLAIYVVAAWVVFEVVQTVTEGLGLPTWFPAFAALLLLIGLPIVLATAFVQEGISPMRRHDPTLLPSAESDDRRREVAGARRLFSWRNAMTGAAMAFGLWGVVATGWLLLADRDDAAGMEAEQERKSIAVLPFENMSPAEEDEYFAAGVHEEIIAQLSKIGDLKVISRTSVMEYKERTQNLRTIASELGVANILEGSVRRTGDRVRITAQLIDAKEDEHLWAENYDRQLSDIFAIQSDVARQIAAALRAALSDAELSQIDERPTDNLEAYDYYLRGLDHEGRGPQEESNLRAAAQMFERAIELDPKFALAYAWLSDTYSQMYHWYHDRTEERMALAREAVDSAFAIVPGLPEAHRALGHYHYRLLDYDRALAQLELAQRSLPNEAGLVRNIGWVKRRQGDFEAARTYAQRAFELDPRGAGSANDLAEVNTYLRDHAEAERFYDLRISLALVPTSEQGAYPAKAWLYVGWKGSTAQARSTLSEGSEILASTPERLWPRTSIWLELFDRNYEAALEKLASWRGEAFDEQQRLVPRSLLHAEILRLKGDAASARPDYDAARAQLERRLRDDPQDARVHSSLGVAYAGLGRIEEAVREAKLGVDLLPFATDALRGQYRLWDLARIYTMVGQYDAAIDQLEILLERPSLTSVALLRIDPTWDALGDHPRFQALLDKYELEQ